MKDQNKEELTENLFDLYYSQDVNAEDEETEMAGYGIYGAYGASSGCC